MHSDRAVPAIIDDKNEHFRPVLHGGCQLLSIHQEIAIACKRHHLSVPVTQARGDSGRHAVAHRSRGWRELAYGSGIAPVAMPPTAEITRAIANKGVSRHPVAHGGNALPEIEFCLERDRA